MWHIHISVSISMWCLFLIHSFWSKFKREFNVELESLGMRMEIVTSWGIEVFPNRDFNVQGWNNIIFGDWYYSLGYCLRRYRNSPQRSPSPCKSPEQPVEAFRVECCQTCEALTAYLNLESSLILLPFMEREEVDNHISTAQCTLLQTFHQHHAEHPNGSHNLPPHSEHITSQPLGPSANRMDDQSCPHDQSF